MRLCGTNDVAHRKNIHVQISLELLLTILLCGVRFYFFFFYKSTRLCLKNV